MLREGRGPRSSGSVGADSCFGLCLHGAEPCPDRALRPKPLRHETLFSRPFRISGESLWLPPAPADPREPRSAGHWAEGGKCTYCILCYVLYILLRILMSADCLLMTVTALQSLHLSAQAPAILSCFLVARFCKQDVALPGQSYPVALAAVRAVLHPDLRSSLGYQRHIFSGLQQHRRTRNQEHANGNALFGCCRFEFSTAVSGFKFLATLHTDV